ANFGATRGNDPQRAGLAFLTSHEGRWCLGLVDIGNIGEVDAGKVVQEVFNIFGDVTHPYRITFYVGDIEPKEGIFGRPLVEVLVKGKIQPTLSIALDR